MSAFQTQIIPFEDQVFTKDQLVPEIYSVPKAEPSLTVNELQTIKEEVLYDIIPDENAKHINTTAYITKTKLEKEDGGGMVEENLVDSEPTLVASVLESRQDRMMIPLEAKINLKPIMIGAIIAYLLFRR